MDETKAISWNDFLESYPSNLQVTIADTPDSNTMLGRHFPRAVVQRHCGLCNHVQRMDARTETVLPRPEFIDTPALSSASVQMVCRNCQQIAKHFGVLLIASANDRTGRVPPSMDAIKYGEFPPLSSEMSWPASFFRKLSTEDRALLNKGRGCEVHGAGIGAMAYYRRAIERNWALLVQQIISTAKALALPEDQVQALQDAANNWQFRSSVEAIEPHIPPHVFIEGKNPITLLYKQVSADLHAASDEECLERAKAVRTVLVYLLDRLADARAAHDELKDSLKLLQ